jgi:hypothetical protein
MSARGLKVALFRKKETDWGGMALLGDATDQHRASALTDLEFSWKLIVVRSMSTG